MVWLDGCEVGCSDTRGQASKISWRHPGFPPQRGEKVICRALFFFFFFDDHVFLFIKGFLKKIHDRLREFLVNGLKQNLIRPRIRYIKKHPASHEVGWKAPLASLSCLAGNLLPVPIQG